MQYYVFAVMIPLVPRKEALREAYSCASIRHSLTISKVRSANFTVPFLPKALMNDAVVQSPQPSVSTTLSFTTGANVTQPAPRRLKRTPFAPSVWITSYTISLCASK